MPHQGDHKTSLKYSWVQTRTTHTMIAWREHPEQMVTYATSQQDTVLTHCIGYSDNMMYISPYHKDTYQTNQVIEPDIYRSMASSDDEPEMHKTHLTRCTPQMITNIKNSLKHFIYSIIEIWASSGWEWCKRGKKWRSNRKRWCKRERQGEQWRWTGE